MTDTAYEKQAKQIADFRDRTDATVDILAKLHAVRDLAGTGGPDSVDRMPTGLVLQSLMVVAGGLADMWATVDPTGIEDVLENKGENELSQRDAQVTKASFVLGGFVALQMVNGTVREWVESTTGISPALARFLSELFDSLKSEGVEVEVETEPVDG